MNISIRSRAYKIADGEIVETQKVRIHPKPTYSIQADGRRFEVVEQLLRFSIDTVKSLSYTREQKVAVKPDATHQRVEDEEAEVQLRLKTRPIELGRNLNITRFAGKLARVRMGISPTANRLSLIHI